MDRVAALDYGRQRTLSRRVRTIHWLIVIVATLAAVAIALPSVLVQPTLYTSSAVVRYDPNVFPDLLASSNPGMLFRACRSIGWSCNRFAPKLRPTDALVAQESNLGGVLEKTRYPTLRQYGLDYRYLAPGQIQLVAVGFDAATASRIAQDAAEGLVRRIYAIDGSVLLRDVLGRELQAALEGHPAQNRDQNLLRRLLQTEAVAGITPQPGARSIASLSQSERYALTRALEVLEDQMQYNQRAAEGLLQYGSAAERAQAQATLNSTPSKIVAGRLLIRQMYDQYQTAGDLTRPTATFVSSAASPAVVRSSNAALKLAIAGVVGAIGGLLTVLIDRQVGILTKLQELWNYRQLIRNMIARDLKARYKNSLLGYIWSLLNPLLTMLIFWVVFSVLLRNSLPMFPVFLIVALLPWNFAMSAVSGGMRSIVDNSNLIKKVYFPREILPIATVLSNFANYLFALPMMFLVMAGVQWAYLGRLNFSWSFAFLPVIVIIQIIFLIGLTLLLSTMAVFFRDTTHIVDIFLQLWIFLTPVFFSLEQIVSPNLARAVRWINPMASIIDFYRDILYGQAKNTIPVPGLPAIDGVFRTLLTALVILVLGSYVFHRYSGRFGEEV